MENVSLKFLYNLENGETHWVTIKDISPAVTEAQITALGDLLIEKRCQHKDILFKEVSKVKKVVTTEEYY